MSEANEPVNGSQLEPVVKSATGEPRPIEPLDVKSATSCDSERVQGRTYDEWWQELMNHGHAEPWVGNAVDYWDKSDPHYVETWRDGECPKDYIEEEASIAQSNAG